MKHRHEHHETAPGDAPAPTGQPSQVPHYAAPERGAGTRPATGSDAQHSGQPLYEDMPSVTNRGNETATGRAAPKRRAPPTSTYADNRITDAIIRRLREDQQIDAAQILVMVEGGVVTLSGDVPDAGMRQRAEGVVTALHEIREVRNRLHVDTGAAAGGPPGEAVRSGHDQVGSGFSSSARDDDPVFYDSTGNGWPSRQG